MADKIVFPIVFDVEGGVAKAQKDAEKVIARLQRIAESNPISVTTAIDTSKLKVYENSFKDSTAVIRSDIKAIEAEWDNMANNLKLDKSNNLTDYAKELLSNWQQLTAAAETYSVSLSKIDANIRKREAEEEKAYNNWLKQKARELQVAQETEDKKFEATRNTIAKQNEAYRRQESQSYQDYWAQKEKEVQAEQRAAEAKQRAQAKTEAAIRQAAHRQAQEAYRVNAALKAQEDVIDNLNAKLQIYQQRIKGQSVGSDAWNRSALEIRRISEELEKANQRLADFQQRAFRGIGNDWTEMQVQKITQLRGQLRLLDEQFNRLNQAGAAYTRGGITDAANDVLRRRKQIVKEITEMLKTANDAQIERERAINQIIEQRKAKEQAIKAVRQQQIAAQKQAVAENKRIQQILKAEENTIKSITQKLEIQQRRLESTSRGTPKFERIAAEVTRLREELERANKEVDKLTKKPIAPPDIKKATQDVREHTTYVERLIKRMAVYASFAAFGGFIQKIREVTAEFELQRISLGAIIQDQNRANQLFSEIKSFALQSPLKILDLTKYTKQLAAYRIETDKLFDTTKRLADVSVGLGVDMSRLILAYGQVKAASYLRAAEIRQFTEAGIPLLELLADKFTELEGKMVSTEQVMDKVSKRGVSFQMVADIFEDMTNKGGMFYNMQIKQGDTLYGMWAKLGDAAAMMYDEIGNTSSVNSALRSLIDTLRTLMTNWRDVARAIAVVGVGFAAMKINAAIISSIVNRVKALDVAQKNLTRSQERLNAAMKSGNTRLITSEKLYVRAARAAVVAAHANTFATKTYWRMAAAVLRLRAALLANWPMIALTAVFAGWQWLESYIEKTNRLKNAIDSIDAERVTLTQQSVRNFEFLADAAVNAADGSKKQKDALDELHRTYKDMIPVQDLTIEKLRALKEQGYEPLTQAIRNYIAEQQRQRKLSVIEEEYGKTIQDSFKTLRKYLTTGKAINVGTRHLPLPIKFELSEEEYNRFFDEFEKQAKIKGKSMADKIRDAFKSIGFELTPDQIKAIEKIGKMGAFDKGIIYALNDALRDQAEAIDGVNKAASQGDGLLKKYADDIAAADKKLENLIYKDFGGKKLDSSSYLAQQLKSNEWIKSRVELIKKELKDAGVEIQDAWFNVVQAVNKVDPSKISTINFGAIIEAIGSQRPGLKKLLQKIQGDYDDLVPKDRTVSALRNRLYQISQSTKAPMDELQRHLMKSGESWKNYSKRVRESVKEYELQIDEMQKANAGWVARGDAQPKYSEDEINKIKLLVAALKELFPFLAPEKSGRTSASDSRLSELNEIEKSLSTIYKKYEELKKKEGDTSALEHINKLYAEQLKLLNNMNVAKRYGLHFDMPTSFASLQDARKAIKDVIEQLKKSGLKGAEKAFVELGLTIDTANVDEEAKKMERYLAQLQQRISQTKTAKEFYDKILGTTGDATIATELTIDVYGESGEGVQKQMADYIRELFGSFQAEVPVEIVTDDRIDYSALSDFLKAHEAKWGEKDAFKELVKISNDGMKALAQMAQEWVKELDKAQNYSDKRLELARKTQKLIDEVNAEVKDATLRKQFISGFKANEAKQASKLMYEAFKDTPLYVTLFSDLDYASSKMLTNMRDKLIAMQGQWQKLDPTQLKELQSRLSEIDKQLVKRNPFKELVNGLKEYRKLSKKGSRKDADNALMQASKAAEEARAEYEKALKSGDDGAIGRAKILVDNTERAEREAEQLAANWKKVEDVIGLSGDKILELFNSMGNIVRGIGTFAEVFGADEEDVQYFNDIADALDNITGSITNVVQAAMSGDIVGVITSSITAIPNIVKGFFDIFHAGKIKRANKEIRIQEQVIQSLTYSYSRLEKAMESALGSDYASIQAQKLRNLYAQQEAYQKQYDAEFSKGKKADEDKLQDFADKARDVADQIKDMEDEVVNYLTGTDITSAARDFANAWLDAYVSFDNTADAIKERFQDMIKSMVVESVMARLVQAALKPVFDAVDAAVDANGNIDQSKLITAFDLMEQAASQIDSSLYLAADTFESMGFNIRDALKAVDETNLTGISREFATASEESINGLAAAYNTNNYYVSQIYAEVIGIHQYLASDVPLEAESVSVTDLVTMQNTYLQHLPAIAANTAATAERCERAAVACERIADNLSRVTTVSGNKRAIATTLN